MAAKEKVRLSKNLKIRVVLEGDCYSGYLYNTQNELKLGDEYILINTEMNGEWNKVVSYAWTRRGCKRAVVNWVKQHTIHEYNIILEDNKNG